MPPQKKKIDFQGICVLQEPRQAAVTSVYHSMQVSVIQPRLTGYDFICKETWILCSLDNGRKPLCIGSHTSFGPISRSRPNARRSRFPAVPAPCTARRYRRSSICTSTDCFCWLTLSDSCSTFRLRGFSVSYHIGWQHCTNMNEKLNGIMPNVDLFNNKMSLQQIPLPSVQLFCFFVFEGNATRFSPAFA